MLLQWIMIEVDILRKNHLVDGIKYRSVKAENSKEMSEKNSVENQRRYNNYVFPTRTTNRLGLCDVLQKTFEVTNVNFGMEVYNIED